MRFYLGVDVGTHSVRAGIFNAQGMMLAMASSTIEVFRPAVDFAEHSSEDIWRACGEATRAALALAHVAPEAIASIGFDATCSLVVLGEGFAPLTVSPTGVNAHDVIVWMDHRAVDQARRINAIQHHVLDYVGGTISPEMQMPKLLWLKENLPASFTRAKRFLDLPDFLAFRATGSDTRSLCTTTCKWTYLGHEHGWDDVFLRAIGLAELAGEGHARIGTTVRPMGERIGALTHGAASDLGLAPGIAVAVSIIDAHAGGLGMLGAGSEPLEQQLALICGTSTCHMIASREPKHVPGVWGPYWSAMVPGMWLTEGGQSATGALLDHTIATHARGEELAREATSRGTSVYALLNERLEALAVGLPFPAALARDLHVLPDHHGNRSPRADPSLRGMVSGLKLTSDVDSLAVLYLATIQAIAHGTKHVIDAMCEHGHDVRVIVACGGDTKNAVFLREHADVTGLAIRLPKEPEAVLLGAAILGVVACGDSPTLEDAMTKMCRTGKTIEPTGGAVADYHARKHQIFLRMHDDQIAYRALMGDVA